MVGKLLEFFVSTSMSFFVFCSRIVIMAYIGSMYLLPLPSTGLPTVISISGEVLIASL